MQKIISCERRTLPCVCAEWCFENSCQGAIQSVIPSGPPNWTLGNSCTLRISLPVCVQLCDGCQRFARTAALDVETELPQHFVHCMTDARTGLFVMPCIRLLRAEHTCGGCFRVQLQVSLEIYLLRSEILPCGSCKPECSQLPLYPPPIC